MRNRIVLILALLIVGISFGQDINPKFEKEGDLVKATYFHDNGKIKQIGFFNQNKLHGKWVSFNLQGNKTVIAQYDNGIKTGTWLVLNNGVVKKVTYNTNKIIEVKKLEETDLVAFN